MNTKEDFSITNSANNILLALLVIVIILLLGLILSFNKSQIKRFGDKCKDIQALKFTTKTRVIYRCCCHFVVFLF